MNTFIRDSVSTLLAIAGGVVMFAKLNSYSWPLIGSWRGALGVLAVLGLGIMLTNIVELFRMEDAAASVEFLAWLAAGGFIVLSALLATTRLEFIFSGAVIGLAWLVQTARHAWRGTHSTSGTYRTAH